MIHEHTPTGLQFLLCALCRHPGSLLCGWQYVWLIMCIGGAYTHTHTHARQCKRWRKPLRDGWAVNKKWHDMIPTAGTNQTACQSPPHVQPRHHRGVAQRGAAEAETHSHFLSLFTETSSVFVSSSIIFTVCRFNFLPTIKVSWCSLFLLSPSFHFRRTSQWSRFNQCDRYRCFYLIVKSIFFVLSITSHPKRLLTTHLWRNWANTGSSETTKDSASLCENLPAGWLFASKQISIYIFCLSYFWLLIQNIKYFLEDYYNFVQQIGLQKTFFFFL